MEKPLAVQLYSVRNQLAQGRAQVLHRLREIGYGAVEAFDPTDDPASLRKVADDLGLTVCGTHGIGLVQGMDAGQVFDGALTLGTELVIVPGGIPKEMFATGDGLKRVADQLNRLAEQAKHYGLLLGYHNHEHELEHLVDGSHALDVLADLLSPEVFLEIDMYWAAVGGADVPALLARHGERVRLVHVKDGSGGRTEPNVVVGAGTMSIPEQLAAAPHAWRVVEFDECAGDILDALEASYTYLTTKELP